MQLEVALVSSLACLALVAAIYSCNILSAPRSWLRGEMLAMILLSLLVSVFPIALAATGVVAWQVFAGSGETSIAIGLIVVPISAAAVAATILVFRALVRKPAFVRVGRDMKLLFLEDLRFAFVYRAQSWLEAIHELGPHILQRLAESHRVLVAQQEAIAVVVEHRIARTENDKGRVRRCQHQLGCRDEGRRSRLARSKWRGGPIHLVEPTQHLVRPADHFWSPVSHGLEHSELHLRRHPDGEKAIPKGSVRRDAMDSPHNPCVGKSSR
jgi:hypothetical protein